MELHIDGIVGSNICILCRCSLQRAFQRTKNAHAVGEVVNLSNQAQRAAAAVRERSHKMATRKC
jgi:hypothetical protein